MVNDTRQRLIQAAADLIAASSDREVSLRTICDRVGVKLPTLYHFFGSREGLLDAVVSYGFDLYVGEKMAMEWTGDPLVDIRRGWDAHVAFGLANPSFYVMMYGRTSLGRDMGPAQRPYELLMNLTNLAAARSQLRVSPRRAADHIIATNVGTTLFLLANKDVDHCISADIRDATLAAISAGGASATTEEPTVAAARALSAAVTLAEPGSLPLIPEETALLEVWLDRLAGASA